MKRLIYTAVLMLTTVTFSYAQDQKRGKISEEARAERSTEMLQKKLALTDDQKEKVKALELERVKKGEEWRKSDQEARKAVMEKRKTYMKEQQAKLEKVLTAEQKEKLKTFREEGKNKMKERMDKRKKGFKGPKGEKPAKQ